MSTLQDKKLHLLGLLYAQDTHGYRLNRQLQHPSNVISISKGNTYKLLARLEKEGFVSCAEERNGIRQRMVYSITESGIEEFKRLLRESLAQFEPLEYPYGVPLNFISILEPQEALALLIPRQRRLADHCEALRNVADDVLALHPGIHFLLFQSEIEYEFVNRIIAELQDILSLNLDTHA